MPSLRLRILVLAAFLVFVTQLGTIAAVLYTANRSVTERGETMLLKAAAVTDELAAGRGTRLRAAGAVLAGDAFFRGAIVQRDAVAVSAILESQMRRAELDLAMVLDPDGLVLASAEELRPRRVSFPGLVTRARRQGAQRTIVQANGHAYEVVTVPIGEGKPMAWLTLGALMDTSFAQRMATLTGLDATLLARVGRTPSVLGTSLGSVDAASLLDDLAAADARQGLLLELQTGGTEHFALLVPFIHDSVDVELLLSDRLDDIMAPYESLRLSTLLLSGVALIVAFAGSIFLSRTVTRPLHALVRAAQRIRDGDYQQPVEVRSDGEVAVLASAINAMQESIAEREARISYHARFDALTGLPSRMSAIAEIELVIRRSGRRRHPLSVLILDLNQFSDVGSSFGHDISDALRFQSAERLRAALDARHMLARVEGDQFVAILARHGLESALEVADDLLRVLAGGLSVDDVSVSVDASIGIAIWPDHASDAEQLLQRASIARNEAKNAAAPVAVYRPGHQDRQVRQLEILSDLRRAARQEEFRLYLQPRIRLADRRVTGAEALVRWQHPRLGFLGPDQFVPLAEKSGNISLITYWALTAAVRECRLWIEEGLDIPVSVNLSGHDLQNHELASFIASLLRNHDLPARNLVIEITEQAVVRDFESATRVLDTLRASGIRISVDDFGTGYSSLAQLHNLPVDELKIDRSFVMDLPGDGKDAAIVRTAIELAHNLELEVLAEGVESAAALDWLEAQGCEHAQGFLISAPMPVEQFQDWVRGLPNRSIVSEPSPVSSSRNVSTAPATGSR